jgi:hypothetical protein
LARADGNLRAAILAYNHSESYVTDVLARARAYARETDVALAWVAGDSLALTGCAARPDGPVGPANLRGPAAAGVIMMACRRVPRRH